MYQTDNLKCDQIVITQDLEQLPTSTIKVQSLYQYLKDILIVPAKLNEDDLEQVFASVLQKNLKTLGFSLDRSQNENTNPPELNFE